MEQKAEHSEEALNTVQSINLAMLCLVLFYLDSNTWISYECHQVWLPFWNMNQDISVSDNLCCLKLLEKDV